MIAPLGSAAAASPPADLVGVLGNRLLQAPSLFDSLSSVGLHGLIALVAAVAAVLTANVIWRRAFAGGSGVAELPNTEWFEYSSPHDLVGRMLLPELRGAREVAVSSGGHPVLDHVSYFSSHSLLPFRVAARILPSLRATNFLSGMNQMDSALLLMGRRRRLLRAELLIISLMMFVLWSFSRGVPLGTAVAGSGVSTVALIVWSGLVVSAWESWESRRLVARFRNAIIGEDSAGHVSTTGALPTIWPRRVLATTVALFVALVTYLGSVIMNVVFGESADVSMGLTSLALVFVVYGVALGAGYAANRWLLLLLILFLSVLHFTTVPVLPHPNAVPDFMAQPGNGMVLADAIAALWIWYLLRPGRMRRHTVGSAY